MLSLRLNRSEFAALCIICAVLLAAGIQASVNLVRLRRAMVARDTALLTRKPAGFSSENGIDIAGRRVIPMPPPFERRAVIFLLRSSSMAHDLSFWTAVSRSLPAGSGVRLIGYCNNEDCVRVAQGAVASIPFSVLQYAEVEASESLLDADAKGESIIRSEEWLLAKAINWRGARQTPQLYLEALLKL